MQLRYRNRKIRTFVHERSQRFGICSQLKMRLAQLREAQDIRSVSAIGNCHRLQKNRHIEADMMALHVTANWRLCFKVHRTLARKPLFLNRGGSAILLSEFC